MVRNWRLGLAIKMRDESGSILPIGIAALSITVVVSLVFLELVGVQLQTLRNKQLADVIALRTASYMLLNELTPIPGRNYFSVARRLSSEASMELEVTPTETTVFSNDGKTMQATVCSSWISITGLSLGNTGSVCASSKARAVF